MWPRSYSLNFLDLDEDDVPTDIPVPQGIIHLSTRSTPFPWCSSYAQARDLFLQLTSTAPLQHAIPLHNPAHVVQGPPSPYGQLPSGVPLRGIEGEALTINIAAFGNVVSPSALYVSLSGTHGAEGYAGSAIQLGILSTILPHILRQSPDHCFLFVHSLNPYGMSFGRRVNESNTDLNRNFFPDLYCGYPRVSNDPAFFAHDAHQTNVPHIIGRGFKRLFGGPHHADPGVAQVTAHSVAHRVMWGNPVAKASQASKFDQQAAAVAAAVGDQQQQRMEQVRPYLPVQAQPIQPTVLVGGGGGGHGVGGYGAGYGGVFGAVYDGSGMPPPPPTNASRSSRPRRQPPPRLITAFGDGLPGQPLGLIGRSLARNQTPFTVRGTPPVYDAAFSFLNPDPKTSMTTYGGKQEPSVFAPRGGVRGALGPLRNAIPLPSAAPRINMKDPVVSGGWTIAPPEVQSCGLSVGAKAGGHALHQHGDGRGDGGGGGGGAGTMRLSDVSVAGGGLAPSFIACDLAGSPGTLPMQSMPMAQPTAAAALSVGTTPEPTLLCKSSAASDLLRSTKDTLAFYGGVVQTFLVAKSSTAMRAGLNNGQAHHPGGILFGGTRPEQGPLALCLWLRETTLRWPLKRVVCVDVHSGLGLRGRDTLLIDDHADVAECERSFSSDRGGGEGLVRAGPTGKVRLQLPKNKAYAVQAACDPEGLAYAVDGLACAGVRCLFVNDASRASRPIVRSFQQEFGTIPNLAMLRRLRAEGAMWRAYGERAPADHPDKLRLVEAFAPCDPVWRKMVMSRGMVVFMEGARMMHMPTSDDMVGVAVDAEKIAKGEAAGWTMQPVWHQRPEEAAKAGMEAGTLSAVSKGAADTMRHALPPYHTGRIR